MAPKPKTARCFIKADTQTLTGGLTGDFREISHDGLQVKTFFASGGFVESFDINLSIRRGSLFSNFCLIPSTIWLIFLKLCCRHSTCYDTSDISRGCRRRKQTNRLQVSEELTYQSPGHSCQRPSLSPSGWEFYPYTKSNLLRPRYSTLMATYAASAAISRVLSTTPFYHSISLVK